MSTSVVPGQDQTCSVWAAASLALLQSLASGKPGNIACGSLRRRKRRARPKEETSILPSSLRRPPFSRKPVVSRRDASREDDACSSRVSHIGLDNHWGDGRCNQTAPCMDKEVSLQLAGLSRK